MRNPLSLILGLMLMVAVLSWHDSSVMAAESGHKHGTKSVYVCPMHPQIVSDRKGSCPICGMDLVKKDVASESKVRSDEKKEQKIMFYRNPMNPSVTSPVPMKDSMGMDYIPVYEELSDAHQGVEINSFRQQLIGVKKDFVQKRPLLIDISTVGKVAYDPDLYVAQEEYLQALKALSGAKDSLDSIREQSADLVASAEKKLMLLGMSPSEIEALKISARPQDNLYFPGNTGKSWIYITIYEYELGLVKEGQAVAVDALAFPGEVFKGKVMALTPILNAQSRSLRVRVEVLDQEGKLKPEMYVNAKIDIDLGEKLALPEEAVMDSGARKIVYIVKDNQFMAREVTLGPKAGEYYEVLGGLVEGEEIVTSGNFLIDAESKLKAAL